MFKNGDKVVQVTDPDGDIYIVTLVNAEEEWVKAKCKRNNKATILPMRHWIMYFDPKDTPQVLTEAVGPYITYLKKVLSENSVPFRVEGQRDRTATITVPKSYVEKAKEMIARR